MKNLNPTITLAYLKQLSDPITSPKSFWSILKKFSNNRKTSCILLLLHNDKFIKNFKEKAEIFNIFFAKQRFLINTINDLPSVLSKKTHKFLSTIHFTSDDILNIIKNLETNKAHGHDMIGIRMIKIFWSFYLQTSGINL